MALTYSLSKKSTEEYSFKREKSQFKTIAFGIGGILVVLMGFASASAAPILVSILCILFGIGFTAATFYLPYINQRFTPDQIIFNPNDKTVTFEMANGNQAQLPFGQVKHFEIDIEKRSPSAANSAGIHYLHHHINLKRQNDATWTITTTTDVNEANQVHKLLNGLIGQVELSNSDVSFPVSDKIKVEIGEICKIRWQQNKYELSIGQKRIQYSESKSNQEREATREFAIADFKCVRYSYSGAIKNKNWTIAIVFSRESESQLSLFFRDLNPVECLQLERWLHQTIQKKLSA